MSVTSHSAHYKYCGTCEYWTGARQPDTSGKRVKFSTAEKGTCLGHWKGHQRRAGEHCSHWVVWAVVR